MIALRRHCVPLAVVLAASLVASVAPATQYNETGHWDWVNLAQWDEMGGNDTLRIGGGTHMALLRGPGGQHRRVALAQGWPGAPVGGGSDGHGGQRVRRSV